MSKQHVMIDLETMGTGANAAIISIGAVKFDINGVDTVSPFYCNIDLKSAVSGGGVMDPSTVLWWLDQDKEAIKALKGDELHINVALANFSHWLGNNKHLIWGNGSDFDNVILANTYNRSSLVMPWKYYNNRCYRTIKNEFGSDIQFVRVGTAHNALDDAISQAEHLIKIYKHHGWTL